MQSTDPTDRREFLGGAAGFAALAGDAGAEQQAVPRGAKFNGIQMGPHTMLDEGIERSLDLIQETAAINAILVYSHTYHGDIRKAPQTPGDRPRRAAAGHAESQATVGLGKTHEPYYKGTLLRHQKVDSRSRPVRGIGGPL